LESHLTAGRRVCKIVCGGGEGFIHTERDSDIDAEEEDNEEDWIRDFEKKEICAI